jgi:hypothetical protein
MTFLRVLSLFFAPLLAWAQPPLTAADAGAVREVIEAQLDAFQKDDAPRAFSYAASASARRSARRKISWKWCVARTRSSTGRRR